ncbi:MAG: SDR family oxidoreductase [Actinobacteria bacterium]|nr:MAG: SDR family oxidoreductase [Actinomycetota bacterium]
MNERFLEGKVAVVTGSGRGIGRAEAMRLAAYGARVVVNDLGVATDGSATDETPADEVVGEITQAGGEAIADRNNIATPDGGNALIDKAVSTWGQLDIVVHNAGFGRPHMIFNMAPDEWDDVIAVHLRGAYCVDAPACRHWRAEAKAGRPVYGRIINTSTGLLMMGGAGQSNYSAAKSGVLAFTEALATEMAPYDVTANIIMPGALTRLARVGWRTESRMMNDEAPFDRTSPVHVAELVCYLASPAAQWMSGQCFQVSGGRVEHVATFNVDKRYERHDRGWTALDHAVELPRLFGAGAHRSDPPPKAWSEQYHARGTSATAPTS